MPPSHLQFCRLPPECPQAETHTAQKTERGPFCGGRAVTRSQHVYLPLDHGRSAAGPEAPQALRASSFLAYSGYTPNVDVLL